jgi:serine phosphatase RsbU (regulator of sigma subunit)
MIRPGKSDSAIDDIKRVIERQKKEMAQSIKYASYIQKALLPSDSIIKILFPEYFLIYLPRDIVSGDFYWTLKSKKRTYFALADCTGHGVPGAFLSILGLSLLNQVIDRHNPLAASDALNIIREYIMKALHQTGELTEQKDGIDMSFLMLDTEKNILEFAGAFQPLYIIRNGNQLMEIPGDKMPIGIAAEEEVSFKNHSIELTDGDMIYLFTDGYVDQFGGPDGKKFKFRPFRNLLLNICNYPMERQKEAITRQYYDWRGDLLQLDDISIFGFRYH